jgi:hypothetical protein
MGSRSLSVSICRRESTGGFNKLSRAGLRHLADASERLALSRRCFLLGRDKFGQRLQGCAGDFGAEVAQVQIPGCGGGLGGEVGEEVGGGAVGAEDSWLRQSFGGGKAVFVAGVAVEPAG